MNQLMRSSVILLAVTILFLTGCGESGSDGDGDGDKVGAATGVAVVNTRLDDEANISVVDYSTGETWNDLLDVEGPCYLAQYGEYVYIVDKLANIISKFDVSSMSVVKDMSTGDSSKPYSVCFLSSTKGYIALNGTTCVGIFNPETMEMSGQIDISSMAAADGKLQQYHCMIKGNRLFVTLRQNTRDDEKTSSLAVINTDDDSIVSELVLQTDGVSGMGQDALGGKLQTETSLSGDLYVAVVNSMKVIDDGAIEQVENAESDSPFSTVIASESDFGGSMATWVFDTNTTGWAIVGVSGDYGLVRFDLGETPVFTPVSDFQRKEYTYALECTDDGLVLVGAKSEDEYGVWVYDSTSNYEKVFSSPIDVGLMPNRILIVRDF